jgi:hypothetical protein
MKATKTSKTEVVLTRNDIEYIIKEYLEMKHLTVDSLSPQIKTVYDGCMGDPGTDEFTGYKIIANTKVEEL